MSKEFVVNGKILVEEDALENYEEGTSLTLSFIPIYQITYKDNNGFGTYLCELSSENDNPPVLNVKGTFVRPLDLGQTYSGDGEINSYRGQKQFKISEVRKVSPKGKRGIISFLKSLEGMKYQAEVIWETYKEDSLKIIKEHPLDLMGLINCAYPEMLLAWKEQVDNIRDDYDVLNKLMALGIRSEQAKILYDKYGMLIFNKLEENPFFLAKEIRGYGFNRCDQVARKIGLPADHLNRLCEGIMMVVDDIGDDGDTFILKDELTKRSIETLSLRMTIPEMKKALKNIKEDYTCEYKYGEQVFIVDGFIIENSLKAYANLRYKKQKDECKIMIMEISKEKIEEAYKILCLEERIVIEDDRVYDKKIYLQETSIAFFIKEIEKNIIPIVGIDTEEILNNYLKENNLSVEEKQREAILNNISRLGGVSVINGAAGCGKTFCIKIVLALMEKIYTQKHGYFSKIILAPTGKASRVAAKATGFETSTIHRGLKCLPGGGFFYNINNKLPYDCIVVDETSMLDCSLAYNLMSAISPRTKIIFMGDTNQLPSIGAGNFLRDIINSNKVNITTLNVVKRQGLDSGIVNNAYKIIAGQMISSNKETMDFLVYKAESDLEYTQKILKQSDSLIGSYGLEDFQVLAPQRTGPQGTNYLNFILQERYNQVKSTERILKQKFDVNIDGQNKEYELYLRAGDKVINTRNDYSAMAYQLIDGRLYPDEEKIGITNGETGIIVQIISKTNEYNEWVNHAIVKFEDKYIVYTNDFDNIELCYAMTIHKSQGSEWPGVILVVSPSQKYMLDKNILYTAETRAKEKGVVISDSETLRYAISTDKTIKRNTDLIRRLNVAFA